MAVLIVLLTNGAREERHPCVQGVPMEVMWRQEEEYLNNHAHGVIIGTTILSIITHPLKLFAISAWC